MHKGNERVSTYGLLFEVPPSQEGRVQSVRGMHHYGWHVEPYRHCGGVGPESFVWHGVCIASIGGQWM